MNHSIVRFQLNQFPACALACCLAVAPAVALAAASDITPPLWETYPISWGTFDTGQKACNAAAANVGWPDSLVFVPDPDKNWRGRCNDAMTGFPFLYSPFRGQHCSPGYEMVGYLDMENYISLYSDDQAIYYGTSLHCQLAKTVDKDKTDDPPPAGDVCYGNPIYPLRGTKREVVDTQFRLAKTPLIFVFDSVGQSPSAGGIRTPRPRPRVLGAMWSTNLHRQLLIQTGSLGAIVGRSDGHTETFSGDGTGKFSAAPGSKNRLVAIPGGYRFVDAAEQSIESYDTAGQLLSIAYAAGDGVTLSYSTTSTAVAVAPAPGYLIQAQDTRGRTLSFTYRVPAGATATQALLATVTDSAANTLSLAFDAATNLTTITWPDTKVRTFHYEDSAHPQALTGVTDENAVRYATFSYDAEGRAISTQHVDGANAFSTTYTTPPQIVVHDTRDSGTGITYREHAWSAPAGTVLTRPNGSTVSLSAGLIDGRAYMSSQDQPPGSGCAASTSRRTYDASGNLASSDDFTANRTCYSNDTTRSLETSRVEGLTTTATCSSVTGSGAALPAGSRKITSQWHPDWPLVTKKAMPGKLITFVYNGQPDPFSAGAPAACAPSTASLPDGKPIVVLCKQVEQATTDADGHLGFSAALQSGVASRVSTWTYDNFGQVLVQNGPRTDLTDSVTNTYYAGSAFTGTSPHMVGHTIGDLQTSANALNQVTTYSQYDKLGHLIQSTDPNNVVTAYAYDARGRLLSKSIGGQTVVNTYDNIGQLTRVTQPDASWIGYEYDDSHRQKALLDNLGNRIDYTLDSDGKRTAENVRDATGRSRRQLTRSIDALGRVQNKTGRD